MEKNLLLIFFLTVFCSVCSAAPKNDIYVKRVSQNHGNERVPFAISVDSNSWTQILNEDENRRYSIIEATSTTSNTIVCLSTTTTASTVCSISSNGQKLGTQRYYYEDYSQAALYGRVEDASSADFTLFGEKRRDSKDTATDE